MTQIDKIADSILKYADGEELSPEEQARLDEWRNRSPDHDALLEKFKDSDWVKASMVELLEVRLGTIWKRIQEGIKATENL